eukprot:TRINITY_DN1021_c2_g1_i1.p1 TRINITY_DN1021_c2_g1~~TRINITY_DN1021_c2_g1_i1.p1  ORF type:complete len:708 (+),score=216.10 TRINITY_DN1021_c2_g1_i1:144-2267(+)
MSLALLHAAFTDVAVEREGHEDALMAEVDAAWPVREVLRRAHRELQLTEALEDYALHVGGAPARAEADLQSLGAANGGTLRAEVVLRRRGATRTRLRGVVPGIEPAAHREDGTAAALTDSERGRLTEYFSAAVEAQNLTHARWCLASEWLDPDLVLAALKERLNEAARPHDTAVVKAIVEEAGIDPDAVYDALGLQTPLTYAVREGARKAVQYFVKEAGGDMNGAARGGAPLVIEAILCGKRGIAADLLEYGAAADARDGGGRTALHWAAMRAWDAGRGAADTAQVLLQYGADPDAHDRDHTTPLYQASKVGHAATVECLLRHGTEVNAERVTAEPYVLEKTTGPPRLPPLGVAVENGYADVVQALLVHGADADGAAWDTGVTPLMLTRDVDIAEMLLGHGASLNARCHAAMTPLLWGARRRHVEMTAFLLESNKWVGVASEVQGVLDARDGRGLSAVAIALEAAPPQSPRGHPRGPDPMPVRDSRDRQLAVLQDLLQHGADADGADEEGVTPLMRAVRTRKGEFVGAVLQAGVDVDAQDRHGVSAAMVVAESGTCVQLQQLADAGADFNAADKYGWTALTRAAYCGKVDVLRRLMDFGVTVDARDDDMRTPLHWAAWQGHDDVAAALLDRHADLAAADRGGWNALMLAEVRGWRTLPHELRRRGGVLPAGGVPHADLITDDACGQRNLPATVILRGLGAVELASPG